MTVNTTLERRSLHYTTLTQFLVDAESLAAGRYETVGNWTYPQILTHLTETIRCSLDGFPFKSPWYLRLIAPLMKNSFLRKPMRAGFKLPNDSGALIPPANAELGPALEELRAQISRFNESVNVAPHPVFGKLTHEEFAALHLRHAELHMSFVVPLHDTAE